ncbi:hypothetical protein [Lysobacter gummosus]|uniref:hypothetical protein n=1 Tax=Lysobacter gummosus TaxID=262324 RepID=UPI00362F1CFB
MRRKTGRIRIRPVSSRTCSSYLASATVHAPRGDLSDSPGRGLHRGRGIGHRVQFKVLLKSRTSFSARSRSHP